MTETGSSDRPSETVALPAGTRVEVRQRFNAEWSRGFEIAGITDEGYRIRRLSDGFELPTDFERRDVRRERKRNDMWWY